MAVVRRHLTGNNGLCPLSLAEKGGVGFRRRMSAGKKNMRMVLEICRDVFAGKAADCFSVGAGVPSSQKKKGPGLHVPLRQLGHHLLW